MSADVIRDAVATASAALEAMGLTEAVSHQSYLAPADAVGGVTLGPPVFRDALVQRKEGVLQTPSGREVRFRAVVSFMGPVPLDRRDVITLSDGLTGPIVTPQGGLGEPFLRTIHLGG